AAFGGDNDEDAMWAEQLVMVQLFQHLLAVLALAEVVVMEDDVIGVLAAQRQRLLTIDRRIDMRHAHLPQHAGERRAEIGEIIHDENALVLVFDHLALRFDAYLILELLHCSWTGTSAVGLLAIMVAHETFW